MTWFARILFHGTLLAALFLTGLVLLAPSLSTAAGDDLWQRVIVTFAEDNVVRRTALAGAAGLLVTALVFFRPAVLRAKAAQARLRKPEGNNFAGA